MSLGGSESTYACQRACQLEHRGSIPFVAHLQGSCAAPAASVVLFYLLLALGLQSMALRWSNDV